jgi:hypothetical protein
MQRYRIRNVYRERDDHVSENNTVRKITGADQTYDKAEKDCKPTVQTMKFIKKINFPVVELQISKIPRIKYHQCTIFLAGKIQLF